MARPKKAAGTLGSVYVNVQGKRWRARTVIRDSAGEKHFLAGYGESEKEARDRLAEDARRIWRGLQFRRRDATTIGEVATLWLATLPKRVALGRIKQQTAEKYEASWKSLLAPRITAVPIENFTTPFVNSFLESLARDARTMGKYTSYARESRKVLSLIGGFAVRNEFLVANPVAEVERMPTPKPEFGVFTPDQLVEILDLVAG